MTDRASQAERASGDPTWERSGALGLPRSAAPTPSEPDAPADRSVASWLGWSPTSWRSRGSK